MKNKSMKFALCFFASTFMTGVFASEFSDADNGFSISYGDEWEINHAISANVKLSLISKQKASGSRRPAAKADVNVKQLDDSIALTKYISNDIKVAFNTWKVLKEENLTVPGTENTLMVLQRNMGPHSQKVYKLFIKAKGNVYEISCAMGLAVEDVFDSVCTGMIGSFTLHP